MKNTLIKIFSGLLSMRATSLLAFSICLLFGANLAQAQTCPTAADYRFQNTRASSVGTAPALTDIGVGANTFAPDMVDGTSRQVLQFPQGNGLQLQPTTGTISNNAYTIVALFKFTNVDGYRRVFDFKNGTSDNGVYIQDGILKYYLGGVVQGSSNTTPIAVNTYVQVTVTRTAAGQVTGYVNGLEQFTFTDSTGDAVIDASNTLRFFKDNPNNEESAGSVARIRLFNCALAANEVVGLNRLETSSVFEVNLTTVTTDANVGDDVCDVDLLTTGAQCTLHAAIQEANATTARDNINFNFPGTGTGVGGTFVITANGLPTITQPVLIDGYTQPGASANTLAVGNDAVLRVELKNTTFSAGLDINAPNVTIRGLIAYDFQNAINIGNSNAVIEGCWFNTFADGTATGQSQYSIIVRGDNATIGGITPAARNVISNSNYTGLYIARRNATVQNNYIGTDPSGTLGRGNLRGGIQIVAEGFPSGGNIIGGTTPETRNVISGNSQTGISIGNTTTGNTIQGNYIGLGANGTTSIFNTPNNISVAGNGNLIGGTTGLTAGGCTGACNRIANAQFQGITVGSANFGNSILGNSIYSNGSLGIDLNSDSVVNLNDPGDADTGANNLQNFPIITSASSGSTRVIGTLNSTSSRTFRLEFFSVPAADASGYGEGQTFIGTVNVTTNGSGDATFDQTFAPNTPIGQFVTATATDLTTGDTSEFSQARQVFAPTAASVSIGGRVMMGKRGIRNVLVTLTEQDGTTRTVLTGTSGSYRFEEITAGQTVIVSVRAKRFTFSQPTRVFMVNEDFEGVNFYADENFIYPSIGR